MAPVSALKESDDSIKTEATTLRRELKAAREMIASMNLAAAVTANDTNEEMAQELSKAKENVVFLERQVVTLKRKVEEMRRESDKSGK